MLHSTYTKTYTGRNSTYVTELAQRSLVQVVSRSRAHGWIERIRIHDILRDWCIEEAREDGFLDMIYKTACQASSPLVSYSSFFGFNICLSMVFLADMWMHFIKNCRLG